MVREVESHLPQISLWVRYCYGEEREPILWTNNIHIRSHAGVQQGDPLGPLLFCLALRPVLEELRKRMDIESFQNRSYHQHQQQQQDLEHHRQFMIAFYMDDGIILAPHHQLVNSLQSLGSNEVKTFGLHLRMDKTRIWWPTPIPPQVKSQYPEEIVYDDGDDDGGVGVSRTQVLGVPVGSMQYTRRVMSEYTQKKARTVRKLDGLNDAHVTFTLLRTCFGAGQVNYHLRTVPYEATAQAAQAYDEEVSDVLRSLAMGTLPAETRDELTLPLKI